jgi:hypothetical protein
MDDYLKGDKFPESPRVTAPDTVRARLKLLNYVPKSEILK